MEKINVEDKFQIKQLLYSDCVLGVKNYRYRSFGGFALWWYDKQRDICGCCEAGWSDLGKKVVHYSLDKAAKILWRYRQYLFLRGKRLSQDRKLANVAHYYNRDNELALVSAERQAVAGQRTNRLNSRNFIERACN